MSSPSLLRHLMVTSIRNCLQTRSIGISTIHRQHIVPMVIDVEGNRERAYDIYSRLLRDRIVCIMSPVSAQDDLVNGKQFRNIAFAKSLRNKAFAQIQLQINDHTASLIVAQLLYLQGESGRQPIHIYINSPGGSVTAGLAIYDTMQYVSAPVETWAVGQACSMASLLLAAGRKGKRHSLPNARIMVHQPSGDAGGQASDIAIRNEEIQKLKKQINEIYQKHTGQHIGIIEQTLDRDRFMSATEARDFGLVDDVIEQIPIKVVEMIKNDEKS